MQGYTQYTASTTSAVTMGTPPNTIAEEPIPLWVYSSAYVNVATSSAYYLAKGSTPTQTVGVQSKLHTLSSSWATGQQFAFEASISDSSTSGVAYAALYDLTGTPTIVSGSQVSVTGTVFTRIRSGSFTLTPGHVYGVGIWSSGSYQVFLTKAHLIALMI